MARCPSCGYPLPDDRERLGARCPSCRDPLYQPPGRLPRPARAGEAACLAHPGSEALGPCGRCGNFLCETCRTRFRGQVLCAACVERALAAGGAAPEQERAHARQAAYSLGLGLVAWAVTGVPFGVAAAAGPQTAPAAQILIGLLLLAAFAVGTALALVGVGGAAASLRARGGHMILATLGLVLSGLYVGALVGFVAFTAWHV
jgi:hypothetical protein